MTQLPEFSASEMRTILQKIFPNRKLVLSQFTFFSQNGIAKPTGSTTKRKRQCYRLYDLLPIAAVLALKERGIPLKNIGELPHMIQDKAEQIFRSGASCFVSGYGEQIALRIGNEPAVDAPLEACLAAEDKQLLYWNFDLGMLAKEVQAAAEGKLVSIRKAA